MAVIYKSTATNVVWVALIDGTTTNIDWCDNYQPSVVGYTVVAGVTLPAGFMPGGFTYVGTTWTAVTGYELEIAANIIIGSTIPTLVSGDIVPYGGGVTSTPTQVGFDVVINPVSTATAYIIRYGIGTNYVYVTVPSSGTIRIENLLSNQSYNFNIQAQTQWGLTPWLGADIAKTTNTITSTSGSNALTVYAYQRSATAVTLKPGDITVTFASGSITTPAIDALSNGWTKSIPAGTDPMYITSNTLTGTGATASALNATWATPVMWVKNGTDATAPVAPAVPTFLAANITMTCPLNADGIPIATASLSWNSVASADSYQLRYKVSGGNYAYITIANTATTSSLIIANLLPSTAYLWALRAFTGTAASAWSNSDVDFSKSTVADAVAPAVPSAPTLVQGLLTMIATWTGVTDQDLRKYRLMTATDSGFTANVTTYDVNATMASFPVAIGTTYWAKVCAIDATGNISAYGTAASLAASKTNGNALITADTITASSLQAVSSTLGAVSAGSLTLNNTSSFIKANKPDFASTTAGFWMGQDGSGFRANFGNATSYIKYDSVDNSVKIAGTVVMDASSTISWSNITTGSPPSTVANASITQAQVQTAAGWAVLPTSGADKTSSNTAAAIANQGALATSTLTAAAVTNTNVNGTFLVNNGVWGTLPASGATVGATWGVNIGNQPTIPTVPSYITSTKITGTTIESSSMYANTFQTAANGSTGKRIILNSTTNEAEFYGDTGAGAIDKVCTIGISATADRLVAKMDRYAVPQSGTYMYAIIRAAQNWGTSIAGIAAAAPTTTFSVSNSTWPKIGLCGFSSSETASVSKVGVLALGGVDTIAIPGTSTSAAIGVLATGNTYGVYAYSSAAAGTGVRGHCVAASSYGIYGSAVDSTSYSGYFTGGLGVYVSGPFNMAGKLTATVSGGDAILATNSAGGGIRAESASYIAGQFYANATTGTHIHGAYGLCGINDVTCAGVKGQNVTTNGVGVIGEGGGYGGIFSGTIAPVRIVPSGTTSAPSHTAPVGSLWVTSAGVLYINTSGSTTWTKVGAQ